MSQILDTRDEAYSNMFPCILCFTIIHTFKHLPTVSHTGAALVILYSACCVWFSMKNKSKCWEVLLCSFILYCKLANVKKKTNRKTSTQTLLFYWDPFCRNKKVRLNKFSILKKRYLSTQES